jgi:ABC-type transport system involved in multi-copper enzyme maturation permease subunit
MTGKIFLFEIKYRMKRPATWAYFAVLFLFGFLTAIYGSTPASEKVLVNSPASIAQMLIIISIFGMLLSSAIMGMPVYRDLEHGTAQYMYSYPITEKQYLFGRYFGSLAVLLIVSMGMQLGLISGFALGPFMGLEEAERFGPFNLWHYIQPTLLFSWPNFIFAGTIFFALVALTRKVVATYTGSVILFIGYLLSLTFVADLENKDVVSLWDPFALQTFSTATQYWTPAEQNTLVFPIDSLFLGNRLIYLGLAAILLIITLVKFNFQDVLGTGKRVKKGKKIAEADDTAMADTTIPSYTPSFSFGAHLRQMFTMAKLEFMNIIKDPYFLAMLLGGVAFLFLDGWFSAVGSSRPAHPTTYLMLEVKDFNYGLFVFIILIFYTGETVHRDKTSKFSNIADALPTPNWLSYGSKFLALVLVALVLASTIIFSGVINQLLAGYTDFRFDMYFKDVYLLEFPDYVQLTMLAFFIHILVNNKFLGHVVTIAFWIVLFGIRDFGEYTFNMVFYSYRPPYVLSDVNGFGHFWAGQNWFNLYWFSMGVILLILGNFFWNRSSESSFRSRVKVARQRLKPLPMAIIGLCLVTFAISGYVIYENTAIKNTYESPDESYLKQANYEKTYRKFLEMNAPKVAAVETWVDIFPSEQRAEAKAEMAIYNYGDTPIDSMMLVVSADYVTMEEFSLSSTDVEELSYDKDYRTYFFNLKKPLMPGDTVTATFKVKIQFDGFPNSGNQRQVVYNGTFFDNTVFPGFGYNTQGELTSDQERKKYELPERDYTLPLQDDEKGRNTFLFTDYAYYVDFKGTVSTEEDQIAIMPGYLQKEWVENGRRYFTYEMNAPISCFFNVVSARYDVERDVWIGPDGQKVNLEIYHTPQHKFNLDRFMLSIKHSFDYFTEHFGPYQYTQMRIMEFPRYAGFAQSFPNTVPFSEGFAWTANYTDPNTFDRAYWVTSHEVAHQWWGHQIAPSATRGSNQISESMAEYSALMVARKYYGADAMQKFLKEELDNYLRSRANESKFEKTLLNNDNQAYVWYQKGGLVLAAVADYIGDDQLNKGFAQMVKDFGMKSEPPYATTLDWYGYINSVTPDSMRYFLEDSFENIVLYENRATKAVYQEKNGKYEVTLTVESDKIYYDGLGEILKHGENKNLLDIGIFAADTVNDKGMTIKKPLMMKKVWLGPGKQTLTFTVDTKPEKAGIDPYNKMIDRIPDDNVVTVEEL